MKTILKLTVILLAVLLLTTCKKEEWYNDYSNFEQVLKNGRWQTVTNYYEPNPDKPNSLFSRKDFVSSNDKKKYYLFTSDYLTYLIYQNFTYDDTCFFVDDVYNTDVSCNDIEFTWEIIEDSLITHAYLLQEIDTSLVNIANYSHRFKIINYSDDRINLEGEKYFLTPVADDPQDTSAMITEFHYDTLTVKWVWELKNIR